MECSICKLFTCYCRRKSVVYENARDFWSTAYVLANLRPMVKVVLWSRGGLTWCSHVGANPIPLPTPLIWRYLGIKYYFIHVDSIRGLILLQGCSYGIRGLSPPSPLTLTTDLDSVRCRLATTDRASEFSTRVTEIVVQVKGCGWPCKNLPFVQFDHRAKSGCCFSCHVCVYVCRTCSMQSQGILLYQSVRLSCCDIVSKVIHRSPDFTQTLINPSV